MTSPSAPNDWLSLEDSFATLAHLVHRMFAKGVSTRSASIKPALLVETQHRFREANYGFRSFREYLDAASRAGYVSLRDAETGPDKDVLPAATSPGLANRPLFSAASDSSRADSPSGDVNVVTPPPHVGLVSDRAVLGSSAAASFEPLPGSGSVDASGVAQEREPSIRSDLWVTFVDWSDGDTRWFDRRSGFAFRLPSLVDPASPAPELLWSEAVRSEPDRFVPIIPIGQARTLTWITDFLQDLPEDAVRTRLAAALDLQQPIREFTTRVRILELSAQWSAFRARRVREYIQAWASANSLQVDIHEIPEIDLATKPTPRPPQPRITAKHSSTRLSTAGGTTSRSLAGRHLPSAFEPQASSGREVPTGDIETLRRWVHELVDRMTAAELLSLPITPDLMWRR